MKRNIPILILAVIILAAIAGCVLFMGRASGTKVVVTVNGQEYASYDLGKDITVEISPADHSWHNTLVIENSTARIIESDCDNQICVNSPYISEDYPGLIVCLPHLLVVELKES